MTDTGLMAEARISALQHELREAGRHLESTWRWRYLAVARLRVLQMALANDKIRRGLPGKAWNGTFLTEHLEIAAEETADPCMDCGGTGGRTDPDTGPEMCPCCAGYGLMDSKLVERAQ